MVDVIFVCGKICSGKNTFCQKLVEEGYVHVVVSDIVKKITQSTDREQLADTKHLDQVIARELLVQIRENNRVVIDGIRQHSILVALVIGMPINLSCEFVWLEVPEEELKRRFLTRSAEKDKNIEFEQALQKDDVLGLGELERWFKKSLRTQIINNY